MPFTINPSNGMYETGLETGAASVAIKANFNNLALNKAPTNNASFTGTMSVSGGQMINGTNLSPAGVLGSTVGRKVIGVTNLASFSVPSDQWVPGSPVGLYDPLGNYLFNYISYDDFTAGGGTIHNPEMIATIWGIRQATGDAAYIYQHNIETSWSSNAASNTKCAELYWQYQSSTVAAFRPFGWTINNTTGFTNLTIQANDIICYRQDGSFYKTFEVNDAGGTNGLITAGLPLFVHGEMSNVIAGDGIMLSLGAQASQDVFTVDYTSGVVNLKTGQHVSVQATGPHRYLVSAGQRIGLAAGLDVELDGGGPSNGVVVGNNVQSMFTVRNNGNIGVTNSSADTATSGNTGGNACLWWDTQTNAGLISAGPVRGFVAQCGTSGELRFSGTSGLSAQLSAAGVMTATSFSGSGTSLAGVAPSARTISTTAPLTGGGDLSANRTFSMAKSTTSVDGYLASADFTTFNNKVGTARAINTTAPVTGGGDLSADRTIAMAKSTASVDGYLASADFTTFNAKVGTGRAINTTAPLTGGGDLSADRTIALSTFVASGASHAAGGVPDPGATAGTMKYLREDATFAVPCQEYNANVTPVTVNAATSSAQNLMSFTLNGGDLNTLLRTLNIFGKGVATVGSTGTVTISVKVGSVTILTWASTTITATVTNLPWTFRCSIICQATGATGKLESGGECCIKGSAGAGATTVYADGNTAVSGSIDLTANQTVQIQVAFGSASSSNSCTQRLLDPKIS